MTLSDALKHVVRAAHNETNVWGSPNDAGHVQAFLGGDENELFTVGGIPILNFYAFAAKAFNVQDFWAAVQKESKLKNLPQPTNIETTTILLQIAVFVFASSQADGN